MISHRPIIPVLRNGDHLTRAEFQRRYEAMPDVKKAQLIEGIVYMPFPVPFKRHAEPHAHLIWWLGSCAQSATQIRCGDSATVRLDEANEVQPDGLLLLEPHAGGQVSLRDGFVYGAPELVAEVAASSVSIERHAKLRAYERNGVCEYVLWRVEDEAMDWFVLRNGVYVLLAPGPDGIVRSERFPGLWLDPAALIAEDLPRVLAVLQQGLASAGHADFVAKLRQGV